MKKILVTIGISNSGKSTWAKQTFDLNPDSYIIVNRDKIRELLFGYTEETIAEYYTKENVGVREKQVTRYEDTLINEALQSGKIPIVDATHLSRKYLERFQFWNVKVELQWFDISLKEAKARNEKRNRKVADYIIEKQYNQYTNLVKEYTLNPIDFTPVIFDNFKHGDLGVKPFCYIFDIDGTLAEKGDRSPYAWLEVGKDSLKQGVATVMIDLNNTSYFEQPKIIVCTGRDEEALDETEKWLFKNNLKYDKLFIRPRGDMRPDWVVKEEMWRRIAEDYYIVGMFDDRLQVVRRARALGLTVFNVEYNNF